MIDIIDRTDSYHFYINFKAYNKKSIIVTKSLQKEKIKKDKFEHIDVYSIVVTLIYDIDDVFRKLFVATFRYKHLAFWFGRILAYQMEKKPKVNYLRHLSLISDIDDIPINPKYYEQEYGDIDSSNSENCFSLIN